jgi:hypothetical protein
MPDLIITLTIAIVPIFVAYRLGHKKGYRQAIKQAEFWSNPSNPRAYRER